MINYVINLKRRLDRWTYFIENKKNTIFNNEIFIQFDAFDGFDHINEIKRFNLENNPLILFLQKNKIIVNKGVLGCYLSHLIILKSIMENIDINDDEYIGIYEDDIFYCSDFDNKYEQFKNINLNELNIEFLYLGGRFKPNFSYNHNDDMFIKTSNKNIFFRNKCLKNIMWDRGTYSYIIKKKICSKLYDLLINIPIKNNKLDAIDSVYNLLNKNIKMFDYFPHLFYSPVNYKSDIQGIYKNDNIYISMD